MEDLAELDASKHVHLCHMEPSNQLAPHISTWRRVWTCQVRCQNDFTVRKLNCWCQHTVTESNTIFYFLFFKLHTICNGSITHQSTDSSILRLATCLRVELLFYLLSPVAVKSADSAFIYAAPEGN